MMPDDHQELDAQLAEEDLDRGVMRVVRWRAHMLCADTPLHASDVGSNAVAFNSYAPCAHGR